MGTSEHVDAVDLVKREALDRLEEVPPLDGSWTGCAETLGGESDAPCRLKRKPFFPHPGTR